MGMEEQSEIGTEVVYIPDRPLAVREVEELTQKIKELYEQGYWVEQDLSLGKAGTLLILSKE